MASKNKKQKKNKEVKENLDKETVDQQGKSHAEQKTDSKNQNVKTEDPIEESTSAGSSSAESKEADEVETNTLDPMKEMEIKLNETHNKYLRLSAEFDNYRKRTLKEKADLLKSASEQVLVNILPVIDDFDRGMSTLENAKDIKAVIDGMHLIHNKFSDFLKQNGVREIESNEKEFDTDLHEAVTKIPAEKDELKGKVVDVIQKGYTLNDKVIRFAKVVVGE